jgi:DNA-binding PadR family transcriptional regulator
MGRAFLGEFEQRVMLAILRCDAKAYPIEIRREIARASGHEPSRGAFYTTLDRLEAKKLVRWTAEGGDAGRDGLPQRKFMVTAEGVNALRASRRALLELWRGLEGVLES